jgi:transcriptional regulator with XRE-family HTH domain
MTQRELAERLGTSPANVSRWETGRAMPGLDRLGALCEALGRAGGVLHAEGMTPGSPPLGLTFLAERIASRRA